MHFWSNTARASVALQGRVWRLPAGGADAPVLSEAEFRDETAEPAVPGLHDQNVWLRTYHRVWMWRLCHLVILLQNKEVTVQNLELDLIAYYSKDH